MILRTRGIILPSLQDSIQLFEVPQVDLSRPYIGSVSVPFPPSRCSPDNIVNAQEKLARHKSVIEPDHGIFR